MCKKSRRTNKKIKCRVRTRKMRGGFTEDANRRANIVSKISFALDTNIALFRDYHFGTPIRTAKWIDLFDACVTNNVPIFVLTSGDKPGIIYSLQLMMLDSYITEVLCNRKSQVKTDFERYDEMTKYEIIENQITRGGFVPKPDGITTSDGFIGYLVDDGEHNYDPAKELSTRIKFIDSKSETFKVKQAGLVRNEEGTGDHDEAVESNAFMTIMRNIYRTIFKDDNLGAYNLIPMNILDMLIREAPNMSVLYLDYDMTLQRHDGSVTFTNRSGNLDKSIQAAFLANGAEYIIRS
jgi:hypothetical protein